jgi:hypothetical protein
MTKTGKHLVTTLITSLILTAGSAIHAETTYWDQFKVETGSYHTWLRMGASFPMMNILDSDNSVKEYYNNIFGVYLEPWPWTITRVNSLFFALYPRLTVKYMPINMKSYKEDDYNLRKTDIFYASADYGVRLSYSFGAVSAYVHGSPRFTMLQEIVLKGDRFDTEDGGKFFLSLGWNSGAGVEWAWKSTMGLFVEYNYGYAPMGLKKNSFEGHQIFMGATFRSR